MNAICFALMMLLCVQTQNGGGQVSPISAQVAKPEAIAAIERQKSPTCVERDRQNRVEDEIERLKAQLAEQQRQIERLSLELGNYKIDVNYQAGLVWARIPQFRFVYHATPSLAIGLSLENPEQYIGGSAGGGTITLPTAIVTPYATQLDNGNTTLCVPNLHPDIVAKIAFDKVGKRDLHVEVAGLLGVLNSSTPTISNTSPRPAAVVH